MDAKSPEPQSLARILVDKGLLSQSQVTSVLEYQCRLPPGQYMSFTDIVIAFEYLTEADLVKLLGDHYYTMKDPISQILIEQGLVSPEQLEQALTVLDTFSREHVAEVLIDLGFATAQTIEQAISKHQLSQSQQLKAPDDSQLKSRLAKAFAAENLSPASAPTPEPNTAPLTPAKQEAPLSPSQRPAENVHLPLGRKLIAAGHLTESELQDALDYQQRLPHVMHKPLGEILVEMGYLSEALLKASLAQEQKHASPAAPQRIGDVLTRAGVVEEWQLAHALRLQFTPAHASQRLGEILVNMGYATRERIEAALSAHYELEKPSSSLSPSAERPDQATQPAQPLSETEHKAFKQDVHRPLGQLLVEREYITPEQLQAALLIQKELADEYTPLGDILVMQGHLTEAQLQEVLAAQGRFQRKPLGQILVDMGFLEEWQLSYALCVQHSAPPEKRIILGDVLLAMQYVTEEQLQAALLEQQR